MRRLSPLLLLLVAGCPEIIGQQCPPQSAAVGQYSLALQGEHPPDECKVRLDGGIVIPLAVDDGGTQSATLCVASAPDGGLKLYLAIATKAARPSDLLPDGGFLFVGPGVVGLLGTPCICPVGIEDTFGGFLTGAWDGGLPLQPDGGLPPITGLSGTLVDKLTGSPTPQLPCVCNVPCSLTYGITGTRL
jgi:hypothetical protein